MNEKNEINIALAGNPNVGKSTIFNCLTGMHQHTGNWSGKTVSNSQGIWKNGNQIITLTDVPGCYSLRTTSKEEDVARKLICDNSLNGVIVVCDGTCLERNLILALQILKFRKDLILCINLMDQVRKKGIVIDKGKLEDLLGVKVVFTESSKKRELRRDLEDAVRCLLDCERYSKFSNNAAHSCNTFDEIPKEAHRIAEQVIHKEKKKEDVSMLADKILTNPISGFSVMIISLMMILWITIEGANYPSDALSRLLFSFEKPLHDALIMLKFPLILCDMLTFGMYRVLAWIISVMLPPMTIFFPLFTLLEDWGILPRVAFNLDRCFKSCNSCGKQALTMCMGLGCNATAVVGCRIMDSERERLMSMLTNSFIPCNGRFPMLITLITLFFAAESGGKKAAILTALILLSVLSALAATKLLSVSIFKGQSSTFILELPSYRKPQICKVILRSILDRTLFVMGRALMVAAPAGMFIWFLANVHVGDYSLIDVISDFFEPLGILIGLDGAIIVAFLLGIPANEIVLPIVMMIYMGNGTLIEIGDIEAFSNLLRENGWTWITAINMMIFALMHWPCAATLLSIKKETKSIKWTALAFTIPLAMGTIICIVITAIYRFIL